MAAHDSSVKGGEQITFRLEDELRQALERIAELNERTLSAEIRRALKKHVTAEANTA